MRKSDRRLKSFFKNPRNPRNLRQLEIASMKLEYLNDTSEGGRFTNGDTDQFVRLYDFDINQAKEFREAIKQIILSDNKPLNLKSLSFIELQNCNLTLRLAEQDKGITSIDNINFYCDLTISGFQNMASLLEPFCHNKTNGYQWLYDLNNEIDFLFSQNGKW